jgi:hypothetical protein
VAGSRAASSQTPGIATCSDGGEERLIDPFLDDGPASGSQLRGVDNESLPTRAGWRASPFHEQTGPLVTRPIGRVCNPAVSRRTVAAVGRRQANTFDHGHPIALARHTALHLPSMSDFELVFEPSNRQIASSRRRRQAQPRLWITFRGLPMSVRIDPVQSARSPSQFRPRPRQVGNACREATGWTRAETLRRIGLNL